jgi:hypothetical protein
MRIASTPRLMTVARTDKETRLKDFVAEGLARRTEGSAHAESVMIVVRNPDSPVARALYAALSEEGSQGVGVRVIFGDTNVDEQAQATLFDVSGGEFRVLSDPRFGAAHEQLIVGNTHVWIGDCLRRDPTKRDAFELYHSADPAIRFFTAASFEKLWAAAKPVKAVKAENVAPEIIAAGQTDDPGATPRNHRH